MCFSAGASISAFSVGVVSLLVMLQRNMQSAAVVYATIIFMQLAEYFAHTSLLSGNKTQNTWSAVLIFATIFLQPVIWSLYSAHHFVKSSGARCIIYGAVAVFSLFFVYFYRFLQQRDALRVGYLKPACGPGDKICRLDWSFLKESTPLSLVFLFFYFFLFIFANCAASGAHPRLRLMFGALPLLLGASLLFMVFADNVRDMPTIVSGFGSIWCISAVLVGPLALLLGK